MAAFRANRYRSKRGAAMFAVSLAAMSAMGLGGEALAQGASPAPAKAASSPTSANTVQPAAAPAATATAASGAAAAASAMFGLPFIPESAVPDAASDAALVSRGAYLARAADCMPCHTGDKQKPFAGGLGLATPFGTLYSVNITSDREAGIGRWTFADFKAAVHTGIRNDGAFLYPAMPFDAYTQITDDDLKALWAYVRRIPAINQANRENGLSFPFDIRLGMLAWRELFFSPAYFKPDTGKSAEWNRGAYLVNALGHCADCHSPRNVMGAVRGKAQFVGTEIDGFYAPDIASAALKKTWTKDGLIQFFKTGSAPGRTAVFGPMAEVIHNSTSFLSDDDLTAMVTYLLDSPPPADKPAAVASSPLPASVATRAARLYIDNCAECHQPHGVGKPGVAPNLAGNPAVIAAEPYNVLMAVLAGLKSDGVYGAMPAFAGRLTDQQVADLTNYIRTSWGNRGAPNATAAMVGAWRATANVAPYATQAASKFDCGEVGGAPGTDGPDPKAVAAILDMLKAGNRSLGEMIQLYKDTAPNASLSGTVNGLVSAYCPIVAARDIPDWQKTAEVRRFAMRVTAAISPGAAVTAFPPIDITWAVPAGKSLVSRDASDGAKPISCPANDGKLVPAALVTQAQTLLGASPAVPFDGDTAASVAAKLLSANGKARSADVANALIAAYCPAVAGTKGTIAEQRSWLSGFSDQVIQTLQLTTIADAGKAGTPKAQ